MFCQSAVQRRLLSCVSSLIDVVDTDGDVIGRDLFAILISVIALHRADDIKVMVSQYHTVELLLSDFPRSFRCYSFSSYNLCKPVKLTDDKLLYTLKEFV